MALASAVGTSIHISAVFAAFLSVWMLISLARRWWREIAVLAVTGLVGVLLTLPYGLTLRGHPAGATASGATATGGSPLHFVVRPFYPVDRLMRGMGFVPWKVALANALALPLNYYLELGLFWAASVVWWRWRRLKKEPLARAEVALLALVATSVVICTFLRSSLIANNDLGWRGFLLAQFGMLLWATDVFDRFPKLEPRVRRYLATLAVLGALGTVYDAAMLRFYGPLADAGAVAEIAWMATDHKFGERNYAARETYKWVAAHTPSQSVLQYDPQVPLVDTAALLYSGRQAAAASPSCMGPFGTDVARCLATVTELGRLFPPQGEAAPAAIRGFCRDLPIDVLVAKDIDAAWADSNSWVWREKPIFANSFFRVFDCRSAR